MKPSGTWGQRLAQNAWKQLLLAVFTVLCLFPVYYLFATAFKSEGEYLRNLFGLPLKPVVANFLTVFRGRRFLLWFLNSIILTSGSVAASLVIALFAAFAFAKMRFRGRDAILSVILTLMIVPPVVMVIPLFKIMIALHILNTYPSVILIYAGLTLPFSIYMLASFFRTIPGAIIDSARMDGCRDIRVLRSIAVPLSGPAVVTIILVNALWVWNELLIAVIFLQTGRAEDPDGGPDHLQEPLQPGHPRDHGRPGPGHRAHAGPVLRRAEVLRQGTGRRGGQVNRTRSARHVDTGASRRAASLSKR